MSERIERVRRGIERMLKFEFNGDVSQVIFDLIGNTVKVNFPQSDYSNPSYKVVLEGNSVSYPISMKYRDYNLVAEFVDQFIGEVSSTVVYLSLWKVSSSVDEIKRSLSAEFAEFLQSKGYR